MESHIIEDNPTRPVAINGVTYRMEVGNVTVALEIADWQEALARAGEAQDVASFRELAQSGTAIVSAALGEDAADDLMGGRNRLNLLRLVQVLGVIADEMAGDEAMAAFAEAVGGFADTGDDD